MALHWTLNISFVRKIYKTDYILHLLHTFSLEVGRVKPCQACLELYYN